MALYNMDAKALEARAVTRISSYKLLYALLRRFGSYLLLAKLSVEHAALRDIQRDAPSALISEKLQ